MKKIAIVNDHFSKVLMKILKYRHLKIFKLSNDNLSTNLKMSLPQVGDQVQIGLGLESRLYQVQLVHPNGVYIFPVDNPSEISLLIQVNNEWTVYGSDVRYQIEFIPSTGSGSQLPITDRTHTFPVQISSGREDCPDIEIRSDQVSPAWRPVIEPNLNKSSPFDENILGRPWIYKYDEWPTKYGRPLSFYAQFYDPNPKSPFGTDLIQIFVENIEDFMGYGDQIALIKTIPRNDVETKMAAVREPAQLPNETLNEQIRSEGKAGKIVGWTKLDTVFESEILSIEGIDCYEDQLDELNFGDEVDINYLLQIGGVAPTFQGIDYRENNTYFNGLYNGYWGDAGTINLTVNGEGFGDMA